MATTKELLATADSALSAFIPVIDAAQVKFYAANNRYWQGLLSHSTTPADGTASAPDQVANKPTDEAANWAAVIASSVANGGAIPSAWRLALSIDKYESPLGHGYIIKAHITVNGVNYVKAIDKGPDASNSVAKWQAVA